jgi:lysophospholipase L1-like esterase
MTTSYKVFLAVCFYGALMFWTPSQAQSVLDKFASMSVYNASDIELAKLPAGSTIAAFAGSSTFSAWNISKFFPGKPYVNRGIGGQTAPQLIVRFPFDVIMIQPKVVIIYIGSNDLAGAVGYESIDMIGAWTSAMTEIALAHGIKVIIASMNPVCGTVTQSRPPEEILELNAWLKNYTEKRGVDYLDYFHAMVGPDGLMRQDLTRDCLHPNDAGYAIMTPLTEAAIQKALAVEKVQA